MKKFNNKNSFLKDNAHEQNIVMQHSKNLVFQTKKLIIIFTYILFYARNLFFKI